MLIIGHRGAKGHAPENTIQSFLKAFELGANGIELDVQVSADGEAVVIHDDTVDRTVPNATGFVHDFSTAECRQFGIPTLTEVIQRLPETAFLNIEIKAPKAAKVVVAEIDKFTRLKAINCQNIVVSSFNWEVLKEVKVLNGTIQLGVLTEANVAAAIEFAKEIKAYSINPYFKLLTLDFVQKARANQFKIHTWTVNSPEDITFVKNFGVEAIISDFPDRI